MRTGALPPALTSSGASVTNPMQLPGLTSHGWCNLSSLLLACSRLNIGVFNREARSDVEFKSSAGSGGVFPTGSSSFGRPRCLLVDTPTRLSHHIRRHWGVRGQCSGVRGRLVPQCSSHGCEHVGGYLLPLRSALSLQRGWGRRLCCRPTSTRPIPSNLFNAKFLPIRSASNWMMKSHKHHLLFTTLSFYSFYSFVILSPNSNCESRVCFGAAL